MIFWFHWFHENNGPGGWRVKAGNIPIFWSMSVYQKQVLEKLEHIGMDNSSGSDKVCMRMVKEAKEITRVLTNIFCIFDSHRQSA